jgi:hypothetical protein
MHVADLGICSTVPDSLMDPNRIIDGCRNQLARELRTLAALSHMILLDRSQPLWQLE